MCDKAGIYLWHNLKTGKSYIGQASKMKESCRKASTKKLKVIQLSLNGNFIAKYCSTRECEEVTGYKHTNIASACRGKYHKSGHKAYGYLWFYENKGNLDV